MRAPWLPSQAQRYQCITLLPVTDRVHQADPACLNPSILPFTFLLATVWILSGFCSFAFFPPPCLPHLQRLIQMQPSNSASSAPPHKQHPAQREDIWLPLATWHVQRQRGHRLGVRGTLREMAFWHGDRTETSGEPERYSSREYQAGKGTKSKRRRKEMSSQEKRWAQLKCSAE